MPALPVLGESGGAEDSTKEGAGLVRRSYRGHSEEGVECGQMEGFVFGERGHMAGLGPAEGMRQGLMVEILRCAPFTAFGASRMTTRYFLVRCR